MKDEMDAGPAFIGRLHQFLLASFLPVRHILVAEFRPQREIPLCGLPLTQGNCIAAGRGVPPPDTIRTKALATFNFRR